MRKLIFVLFFTMLVSLTFAQKISFGPRIVASSSKINLNNTTTLVSEGAEIGYQFGAFARLKAFGLIIQPEILFSSFETNFRVIGTGAFNVDFSTIDIPIMVGYKLGPVRLQAGPTFSILTSADLTNPFGDVSDFKGEYHDNSLGYQAGIGIDLLKFVLDLKYEGRFGNFADLSSTTGFLADQTHEQFVFALGYRLF